MATVDVPWDCFVFRIQAYYYIVKVILLTVSAQQREEPACVRIPPPPGLFRVKFINGDTFTAIEGQLCTLLQHTSTLSDNGVLMLILTRINCSHFR